MKLWEKNTLPLQDVERFTVGRDREMDIFLARHDIIGSLAHVQMLGSVGLLQESETRQLTEALRVLYREVLEGSFTLQEGVEDVHSQVELLLIQRLGDTGKKIHAARSRNDQVLVDIRLFLREEIRELAGAIASLFNLLQERSERHKDDLLPGYTHLQLAMPSSFGLWFGAWAESLVDDMVTLKAAYEVVNKNPLGSAAGYGSSFPIDRTLTTRLLGFSDLNYNVVYAQLGRGKVERIVAQALANLAETLARLSMDACLYLNQNFGFISFPEELTTGSSIMPHKKNPDVFEIVRAHCNRIKALPNEIMLMTTNLPSGYHRDLQLLKEHLFPAFTTLRDCISMTGLMLSNITVRQNILDEDRYNDLFSVEEVNRLVREGMPFRDAYKKVGMDIEAGRFQPAGIRPQHTHEGSIGQLCTEQVRQAMDRVQNGFPFASVEEALSRLTDSSS